MTVDEAATPPDLAHDLEAFALVHEKNGTTGDTAAMLRQAAFEIRRLRSLAQPSGGAAAISAERERQVSKEGWSVEHDDEHSDSEMALAAFCYLYAGIYDPGDFVRRYWPWDWSWWKPADNRRNLIKAGALIAAEIDRLDRASTVTSTDRASPPSCGRAGGNCQCTSIDECPRAFAQANQE